MIHLFHEVFRINFDSLGTGSVAWQSTRKSASRQWTEGILLRLKYSNISHEQGPRGRQEARAKKVPDGTARLEKNRSEDCKMKPLLRV